VRAEESDRWWSTTLRNKDLPEFHKEIKQRIVQVLSLLKPLGIVNWMHLSSLEGQLQDHGNP